MVWAAENRHEIVGEGIISAKWVDADSTAEQDRTPLLWAVLEEAMETVAQLPTRYGPHLLSF